MTDSVVSQESDIPGWRITGDWWDLCNCDIGCPCNFGSNPTLGYCEGVLTWLIRDGNYGSVSFGNGLAVVLIIHFEGNVMEKNREFGFLIDDRANAAQRDALEKIHRPRRRRFCGVARSDHQPRRRCVRTDDRQPRCRDMARRCARHGRRPRRPVPQIHGSGKRHLPHLQRAAPGGRAGLSHRRASQAQRRDRRVRARRRWVCGTGCSAWAVAPASCCCCSPSP